MYFDQQSVATSLAANDTNEMEEDFIYTKNKKHMPHGHINEESCLLLGITCPGQRRKRRVCFDTDLK